MIKTENLELEENLAKDFQQYVNAQEAGKSSSFWGKILEFFQRLYTSLKQIFSSERDIKDFYQAVADRKASEFTDVKANGEEQFNKQFNESKLGSYGGD